MCSLGRPPIAHPYPQAGNILLGEDGAIALTDFGVSGLLYDYNDRQKQKTRKTFVGKYSSR